MKRARGVLLVLAVLVVAGCGGRGGGITGGSGQEPTGGGSGEGTAASGDAESLWGHTFPLTEAYREDTPMTLVAGTKVFLRFDEEDHAISANAGCNTLRGQASLDGGRLTVEDLVTTDMGCDPPRHAQDEWLGDFLTSGPRWELDGTRLTLRGGDTRLVLTERSVAEPDRALSGTVWTVTTLVDGEVASSVPAGTPPATVEFDPNGTVKVFTGCNSGTAMYGAEWDTITMDPLTLTKKACPGDIMELESALVAVLEGTITYDVTSDVLTLEHPSGKGLQLRAE